MEFIKSILSSEGDMSAMRVMSLLSLFAGICIAIYGMKTGQDLAQLSILVSSFVTPAFLGKVIQAKIEAPK